MLSLPIKQALMVINSRIDAIKVNGNELCLDFLNTISHRFKAPLRSYFVDIYDIIYWGWKKVSILNEEQCLYLEEAAKTNLAEAERFFEETIALRTRLDHIFYPISEKKTPEPEEVKAFDDIVRVYRAHQTLRASNEEFVLAWDWEPGDFRQITAPIVLSALELLLSPRLGRVGHCARCGWLFLDTTKNGKRRWCSMEECGSVAKAKEYYHRHKNEK
jgi:predicted RNA-binding Zn ribbon-like protein